MRSASPSFAVRSTTPSSLYNGMRPYYGVQAGPAPRRSTPPSEFRRIRRIGATRGPRCVQSRRIGRKRTHTPNSTRPILKNKSQHAPEPTRKRPILWNRTKYTHPVWFLNDRPYRIGRVVHPVRPRHIRFHGIERIAIPCKPSHVGWNCSSPGRGNVLRGLRVVAYRGVRRVVASGGVRYELSKK